jgi:hypothetical protein
MKIKALALLCLISSNAFAADEVKIKDVKKLITEIGPENTCMDEYLKRRTNLIIQLSLTPVTVVAGTYVGAMGVGLAGVGLASALAADQLVGFAFGLTAGALGGSGGTISASSIAAVQLADIDRIVKALAEQHLNQPGEKSAKLYAKYAKKSENPVDEQTFFTSILELDDSGKLCDGSMVKKPRIGSGRSLKHKLARTKQLAANI